MKSKLILAALLVWTPLAASAGPASDAVAFFYSSPGAEFDPGNRDRFTDPAKSVLDANEKAELCIDFAFSIDAQDVDEAELQRTLRLEEEVFDQDATVTAYFTLFPGHAESERIVVWTLKEMNGEWKIADVMSDGSSWLLSEFNCEGQ